MRALGVDSHHLQRDETRATGTAHAVLDSSGQAKFSITEPVAWDFLQWTSGWEHLAKRTDAVCFGTLAQRSHASRQSILNFLRSVRPQALRVFDVNLRQSYFTRDILVESLKLSNVVKLNHEELPTVAEILGLSGSDEVACAARLREKFSLKMVCITRGMNGSLLAQDGETSVHSGFHVAVIDTIGAGDAFTACLTHHHLRGKPLAEINEAANRFAAWVASCPGATPSLNGRRLQDVLAEIA